MRKLLFALLASFIGVFVASNSSLTAEEFKGIEFPQGAVSFADEVIEYNPSFSGGNVPSHPDFIDPSDAVGAPNSPPR
jgi:hypothetical protein